VEHFYAKFGDSSCIGFGDIVRKMDRPTNGGKNPTPATAVRYSRNQYFMQTKAQRNRFICSRPTTI